LDGESHVGGGSHQSIYGYKQEKVKIENYFKWMFVRNPYDRLVSSYHYCKRTVGRKNVSMRNHFWMLESFERYIRNLDELFDFNTKNFDILSTKFVNVHMIPQHYFACINGEIGIDFIGRLENIKQDWEIVCNKLKVDSKLEISNQSKSRSHWFDYYTPELLDIVNNKYYKDFDLFNYNRFQSI